MYKKWKKIYRLSTVFHFGWQTINEKKQHINGKENETKCIKMENMVSQKFIVCQQKFIVCQRPPKMEKLGWFLKNFYGHKLFFLFCNCDWYAHNSIFTIFCIFFYEKLLRFSKMDIFKNVQKWKILKTLVKKCFFSDWEYFWYLLETGETGKGNKIEIVMNIHFYNIFLLL